MVSVGVSVFAAFAESRSSQPPRRSSPPPSSSRRLRSPGSSGDLTKRGTSGLFAETRASATNQEDAPGLVLVPVLPALPFRQLDRGAVAGSEGDLVDLAGSFEGEAACCVGGQGGGLGARWAGCRVLRRGLELVARISGCSAGIRGWPPGRRVQRPCPRGLPTPLRTPTSLALALWGVATA